MLHSQKQKRDLDFVFATDKRCKTDKIRIRIFLQNSFPFFVPGSKQVEKQAKAEGLDVILADAGFELREPGCSACLGMNEDKVPKGAYCVSTSNRNFEGRQGNLGRTHLMSPLMAALTAVNGRVIDPS